MDRTLWLSFLRKIENLQVFSLCEDFDRLTLNDKEDVPDIGQSSKESASTRKIVKYRRIFNPVSSYTYNLPSEYTIAQSVV